MKITDEMVDRAWPEAADYLDEHPDRLERVARALVERVLAAALAGPRSTEEE